MILAASSGLKMLLKGLQFNASFYKTVTFFSEVEAISSHL